jgi:Xaa-Pro aminopeptidase
MADWWELKSKDQAAQVERKIQPISNAELNRRWAAVRRSMEEHDVDVLIVQASHNYLGGYARWLTDTPAKFGFQDTILFPRDDFMTVIRHGPENGRFEFIDGKDPVQRGVKQLFTAPFYGSINYTRYWAADYALKVLRDRGDKKIGLVATDLMSASFVEHLKENLPPDSEISDSTELIDEIKATKSPEELALLQATAAMQDAAFLAVLNAIRPGMRDFEVAATARYACEKMGSEDGLYLGSSGPIDTPTGLLRRPNMQGRTITPDSYYTVLIESSGPGGFYTELARTVVFGNVPQQLADEVGLLVEAQQNTVKLLRPGASPPEIFQAHADFMQQVNRPKEVRNFAHGQGYDVMERPLIRPEESMPVRANMCFAVHPSYATTTCYAFMCDSFIVDAVGAARRIHQTKQTVFSA